MKAKLYFAKLKECKTEDSFMEFYESMLYDLVKETEDLIALRRAQKDDSIKSCVLEVDKKYKAIIRLLNKYKDELYTDLENSQHFILRIKFLDDGFKAIYVQLHPEHKWVFDIENHIKNIEKIKEENAARQRKFDNFFLHKVTPFEELTMDNLRSEILACLHSLGSFGSLIDGKHITIEMARPLAYRVTLLRWWLHNNKIDLNDVKDWEADKQKWCEEHQI